MSALDHSVMVLPPALNVRERSAPVEVRAAESPVPVVPDVEVALVVELLVTATAVPVAFA